MDLSDALEEQRSFIEHPIDRPALLAAGPGTGKTWVLERRSEFLVERGVDPTGLSVLTLTRSLSAELSERIPHGSASTLHSFALRHLNLLGDAWGRIVVSPWEQREMVRHDLAIGYRIAFNAPCSTGAVDRFLKKLGASFRDNQEMPADLSVVEERLRQVFIQHRGLFGYCLMDELAYDLVRLIEAGTEMQAPPTHLLVDEYQDLTAGELRLLQLLQERCGATLNAAGDDRQSIYGFREADPLALHRFTSVYGIDTPDYLWRSRRCPQVVCDFANLIAGGLPPLEDLERQDLQPWPGRSDEGELVITSYPSPASEARNVVRDCVRLIESGVRPSDVIVVVAAYHGPVFSALNEAANAEGRDGLFVDPRAIDPEIPLELRLAATCARILRNSGDQLAWRTLVWATPGLGNTRLRRVLEADGATYLARMRQVAEHDDVTARPLAAGDRVLSEFAGRNEIILRDAVILAAEELHLMLDPEALDRLGQVPIPLDDATRMLFELDETVGEDEVVAQADGIAVHTIFSSKGLQAPHVFLVNAVNESFAGRGDVASGLRMAYVAATRASASLRVSGARYMRHTALGNQMGVDATRPADFLVDHAHRIGVQMRVVEPGG